MHILHIIQRYYPARGGAEIHFRHISNHLAALGHRVTIATTDALDFEIFWDPRRRRLEATESWDNDVRILRFPVRHLPWPGLSYPAWRRLLWVLSFIKPVPDAFLARLAYYTPWVPTLQRWLKSTSDRFDLVAGMTICFEPLLEAGLAYAQEHDVPFVNYPLTHLGAGKQPGQDALSRFYTMRHQIAIAHRSQAIMAQTQSEQNFYEDQGIPKGRIYVAGPGVRPDEVLGGKADHFRDKYQLDGPIVLSLGSMSYDKGTVHTVEAVRQLWRAGFAVELVLIGAVLTPFQRYLNTLPAVERNRIYLLGAVDEVEKKNALAACDVLVMPSRTDSFGIAYLEAWLYQKPVIGAQTWGVTDVISHEQDGLLVGFADVPALAQAICYLVDHPAEAAVMGQRGAQKVYNQHTWDHKVKISQQLYERLVRK